MKQFYHEEARALGAHSSPRIATPPANMDPDVTSIYIMLSGDRVAKPSNITTPSLLNYQMKRVHSDGKLIRQFSRFLREFGKEHKLQKIYGHLMAVIPERSGFGFDTLLVYHSPTANGTHYIKAKLIHSNGTIHDPQMTVEFIAWSPVQIVQKLVHFRYMYMTSSDVKRKCSGKCHVACPLCIQKEFLS